MANHNRLWENLRDEFADFVQAREPSDRLLRDAVFLNCGIFFVGSLATISGASGGVSMGALVGVLAIALGMIFFGFVAGMLSSGVAMLLLDAFLKHTTGPLEREGGRDALIATPLRRWTALVVLGVLPLYAFLLGASVLGLA